MKLQQIVWNKNVITITYGNGSVFTGDCEKLPKNIWADCDAARHGIAQKLGDAKSGGTAAEKFAEVSEIWPALLAGNWNRRGTSGGVEAYMERAYQILAVSAKQKPAQAKEWYDAYLAMPEAKQTEVRAKPFMKAAIDSARAEKKLATPESDKPFNPNE